jgi:hypothetical protein
MEILQIAIQVILGITSLLLTLLILLHKGRGAGFASLKYFGAGMASDVVLDGGIGSSSYNGGVGNANHMWFLNTKYLMFRPHKDRNFVPIGGDRQAVNQDAKPTIH